MNRLQTLAKFKKWLSKEGAGVGSPAVSSDAGIFTPTAGGGRNRKLFKRRKPVY